MSGTATTHHDSALVILPDDRSLSAGLGSVLRATTSSVTVLERAPHEFASTFPIEFVHCEDDRGARHRLLVKYSADTEHNVFGHRAGVAYEASVYLRILEPL